MLALRLLVSGGLFGLAGTPTETAGAAFEVEGEITRIAHDQRRGHEYYEEGKEPESSFRYQFSVTVADRRYFIRVVPLFNQTAPELRYVEAGFDGEQQYAYVRSGRHSRRTEDGVDHVVDQGYLSWGSLPAALLFAEPVIPPLWLAFASGNHLKDEKSPAHLPPLWAVPVPLSLLEQVSFPCQFELLEGSAPVPRRAVFHWEGIYYAADLTQGLLRHRSPDPDDQGWVKAEYQVGETMTVGGTQLPRSARFREYTLERKNQRRVHRLVSEVDIRVTNALATVKRQDFVPGIVTITTIMDGRRVGNPVVADYSSTNWPRLDERRVQYAFRRADEVHRETLLFWSQHRSWRLIRLIFFVALTAVATAALVQWLRRKPTCTPK